MAISLLVDVLHGQPSQSGQPSPDITAVRVIYVGLYNVVHHVVKGMCICMADEFSDNQSSQAPNSADLAVLLGMGSLIDYCFNVRCRVTLASHQYGK